MTEKFTQKEIYVSNGKVYTFESDPFEPKEKLNKRAWLIIKYIEEHKLENITQNDLDELIKQSRMWINEMYYGAKYK